MCDVFCLFIFAVQVLTVDNPKHSSVVESICQLEVNPVLSSFPSLVDLLAICSVAAVHEFYMYS